MATTKTFADDELLTAADVNTYLVNNITRRVYSGADAITLTRGSIMTALAVADEDRDTGIKTVTLYLDLTDLGLTSSTSQTTHIGDLNPDLRSPLIFPLRGGWTTNFCDLSLSSNGLSLRSATSNFNRIAVAKQYPIPAP